MARKSLLFVTILAIALATHGSSAVIHDDDHRTRSKRSLKADLSGFNEVMTVSSPARGSFRGVLSRDAKGFSYRLVFKELSSSVTQSHIHFGAHHTNGGISVWLCQTDVNKAPAGQEATPMCAAMASDGRFGEVVGEITEANVIGPSGQGISSGEFEEFIRAVKAGRTYVNVHSATFPGGEIRGQIKVDD